MQELPSGLSTSRIHDVTVEEGFMWFFAIVGGIAVVFMLVALFIGLASSGDL